jgi:hypothetical protein
MVLEKTNARFGYASPCTPADIVFLETIKRRGGEIYVVLPVPLDVHLKNCAEYFAEIQQYTKETSGPYGRNHLAHIRSDPLLAQTCKDLLEPADLSSKSSNSLRLRTSRPDIFDEDGVLIIPNSNPTATVDNLKHEEGTVTAPSKAVKSSAFDALPQSNLMKRLRAVIAVAARVDISNDMSPETSLANRHYCSLILNGLAVMRADALGTFVERIYMTPNVLRIEDRVGERPLQILSAESSSEEQVIVHHVDTNVMSSRLLSHELPAKRREEETTSSSRNDAGVVNLRTYGYGGGSYLLHGESDDEENIAAQVLSARPNADGKFAIHHKSDSKSSFRVATESGTAIRGDGSSRTASEGPFMTSPRPTVRAEPESVKSTARSARPPLSKTTHRSSRLTVTTHPEEGADVRQLQGSPSRPVPVDVSSPPSSTANSATPRRRSSTVDRRRSSVGADNKQNPWTVLKQPAPGETTPQSGTRSDAASPSHARYSSTENSFISPAGFRSEHSGRRRAESVTSRSDASAATHRSSSGAQLDMPPRSRRNSSIPFRPNFDVASITPVALDSSQTSPARQLHADDRYGPIVKADGSNQSLITPSNVIIRSGTISMSPDKGIRSGRAESISEKPPSRVSSSKLETASLKLSPAIPMPSPRVENFSVTGSPLAAGRRSFHGMHDSVSETQPASPVRMTHAYKSTGLVNGDLHTDREIGILTTDRDNTTNSDRSGNSMSSPVTKLGLSAIAGAKRESASSRPPDELLPLHTSKIDEIEPSDSEEEDEAVPEDDRPPSPDMMISPTAAAVFAGIPSAVEQWVAQGFTFRVLFMDSMLTYETAEFFECADEFQVVQPLFSLSNGSSILPSSHTSMQLDWASGGLSIPPLSLVPGNGDSNGDLYDALDFVTKKTVAGAAATDAALAQHTRSNEHLSKALVLLRKVARRKKSTTEMIGPDDTERLLAEASAEFRASNRLALVVNADNLETSIQAAEKLLSEEHAERTRVEAMTRKQVIMAILFADIVGYSKLAEFQVLTFVERFLGAVGALIDTLPVKQQ